MAWTSWGFDGTINEAQWSQMAGLLGNGYVAAGNGDCLVTAVPGARSVSVAAGTLYGDGVVSVNSGAETVAMTTPVNGQWFVIALRRTWATNTAALVAIAGATTTTTTPTVAPSSFPTLNTSPGTLTDQPIAWAWCNSANTTVVIFDIRLKAVKSLPPVVANAAERDAKFMAPTQGLQVWRDDLGAVETYYGLYNATTNPGGRDVAGYYVDTRQTGLRPIQPTSATIVSGTGSANSLGVVSFSGATSVALNNIFSSAYKNYKIVMTGYRPSGVSAGISFIQLTTGGVAYTTNYVGGYTGFSYGTNTATGAAGADGIYFAPLYYAQNVVTMDVLRPNETIVTQFSGSSIGSVSTSGVYTMTGGTHEAAVVADGIRLAWNVGAWTGSIQVFGYND